MLGHIDAWVPLCISRRWRAVRRRSLTRRLEARVDWQPFDRLCREQQGAQGPRLGALKYFDRETYLPLNVDRAMDVGLHRSRPQRVFDLGCGFGYFLLVARLLGHSGVGLDYVEPTHPNAALYPRVTAALGVQRIEHRIDPFQPLPDLGPPFDLVTAHQICFAGHCTPHRWDVAEWSFFLADLKPRLTARARVHLEFNPHEEFVDPADLSPYHSNALAAYFTSLGARVQRHLVAFDRPSQLPDRPTPRTASSQQGPTARSTGPR